MAPPDKDDVGKVGGLLPVDAQAPADVIADEMLSRVFASEADASDFVLETMQNDPRPEVQAKGCSAISQIAEKREGRALLHSKSVVDVVVAAMLSAMAEEVELQIKGCSALANLVIGEGDDAVLRKGGLEAVLNASRMHPNVPAVQRKVCLALGNMAYSSFGEARVVAEGGIQVVLTAMKTHGSDPEVQEEGIDALVNLADSENGKKELLARGGLGVVAAAKKHEKCAAAAGDLANALVAVAKAA